MNETNETTEVKKMSRYQQIRTKVQSKLMRVLTVSIMFGTMAVSNASANSSVNFTGVTDVIDAVIPLFSSIIDLVIAIVPLTIVMAIVGGLVILINKALTKALK